mgnify:CR=1 FL=1
MERAAATRIAILEAFSRLVLETRRIRPPVAQLLRRAGVARSTFYEHFNSRDTLMLAAMEAPLCVIAEAITGAPKVNHLAALLEHFWDRRRDAIHLLSSHTAPRIVRKLADLIGERAASLDHDDAIRIADTQIGFVRLWITAETPSAPQVLAEKMIASGRAQIGAFGEAGQA